ncbi:hypothetical protein PACILC2_01640 [Paenibacillus cisolokensis]|uniref:Uncharacterized protein n=1 Tax=Paenibacillus cisolokensis TaxID=1658519 RepID=A0ABQ4N092_9BACL|nr:hypothetical protein [Paenibacillus cisolokensis]GIQ61596.1 hypothetical protein PACILC2_01640 [Paenibacillus cisolokensis]
MSRKVLRATVLSIVTALLLPLSANANGPQQDTDIVVMISGENRHCLSACLRKIRAAMKERDTLLQDAHGILIQQTENVQAGRQIRFTNVREIVEMETILKAYIHEAVEVEKAGLEVNFKKNTEFIIPEELQNKFDEILTVRSFELLFGSQVTLNQIRKLQYKHSIKGEQRIKLTGHVS